MRHKTSSPAAVRFLLDGAIALADIEATGVRVDMKYLNQTTATIKDKITGLQADMRKSKVWRLWEKTYGTKANMGSRPQLAHVLYKKLGYAAQVKTETGMASTDKSALDHIDHPFVRNLQKVETLKTTLKKYLSGLAEECVKHSDGWYYVHPFYRLNSAASVRSSCNRINFQNQPKRDEEMADMVRRCFLPLPGHHMVDFDFGTLEVYVAYFYHKDPVMKKYLTNSKTDMHRDTAADLFRLPVARLIQFRDEAKKSVRDAAKNMFVFPEFYGSVYFQCAKNIWEAMLRKDWKVPGGEQTVREHLAALGVKELGLCDPEKGEAVKGTFEQLVQQVEKKFWKRFAVYDQWKKDFYNDYLRRGHFGMLTGFVINTPHKKNDVTNYPVQGSAFHCLLWCLIQMTRWLRKNNMRSRVIGEIHDSATLSVHPAELQTVINKMVELMTVDLACQWDWITLPLKVEVEVAGVNEAWNKQRLWKETNAVWGPAA